MVLRAAEFKTGDTTVYEGQLVKIVSSQSDFVVIEYESGNRRSVRKDALKSTPLFNFYSDEAIKKRKEQIAHYQEKAAKADEEKERWGIKLKELRGQLQELNKFDELYAIVKKELWNAKFKVTACSNRAYSYLMDAYLTASSIS